MRLRLRWWRELFFAAALLFSLVALLPLRLAIDWLGLEAQGLSADRAEGSVWLGALTDARFGPVELGDVGTRLRVLPLLVGRARIDLRQEDGGLRAGLSVSRHAFAVDDATGTIETPATGGLPPAALDLADLSVRFADGLCASAEGRVSARFSGALSGVPLASGFSGEARCERTALRLPLVSQAGSDRLDLRLSADGHYQVDAALRSGAAPYSGRLEGSFDSPSR